MANDPDPRAVTTSHPGIPTDTIDKLARIWASVSELGAGLTEEEWKAPTELPGWTVQDNLAHLIGTERMLEGLPATEHRSGAREHVHNAIGAFNENEVDARRGSAGTEVLVEWDGLAARRLATLRSAGADYFAAEAMTPTGPGTVADFLHIRILDCWAHEQDIRRALGRPGHLDGPAAEHTIDRLIRTLPIVVGKRAGTPEGATVVIELTGPVHRVIPVTVAEGRAKIVADVPADVLAQVSMDSETFMMLATGRRTSGDLAERWSVDGDQTLGNAIASHLNMMI